MFPMWQQSLVILVIFGLAQLVQLWLSALTGNRQPTLALVCRHWSVPCSGHGSASPCADCADVTKSTDSVEAART
jgi:hypothetical protein